MSDSGKHGNRRRGTMPLLSWGALGVLGVTLSAAAALGAFALTQRSATPAALAESGDDAVLRSTPTRVDDRRRIELVPDLRPAVAGRAPRAGTLTTFTCTPGRTVRTGSVLASVDGKDLLAISTSVPLWRDLSPGVSGADVTALQKALRKLRPELVVTRRYDTQTRRALGEIYAKAGLDRAQTTLRRDSVIWLAPGATRIASCNAGLGQQVNAGQELFVMERTVRSFRVKTVPDDLVAGARRLTLEKAKVNLKGLGAIAEPADVARLARTAAFRSWLDSGGKTPITADLALTREILALPVPATAVVSPPGGGTCLTLTDGNKLGVTIVTSSMGRSLVTWDRITAAPVSVVTSVEADETCD